MDGLDTGIDEAMREGQWYIQFFADHYEPLLYIVVVGLILMGIIRSVRRR